MLKTLGVVLAGVFVGAVAVEILSKKKPKSMKKIREQATKVVESAQKSVVAVKNAFVEGFTETAQQKATA